MKTNELKDIIREMIEKVLAENQPAPSKPKTNPTVAPGKPDTGKPKPRRPFEPKPGANPSPKAEGQAEQVVNKIANRYQSKKEGLDDLSNKLKPYSKFENPEELLKSINGRLIAAIQLKEWALVEEIASDVYSFIKNK